MTLTADGHQVVDGIGFGIREAGISTLSERPDVVDREVSLEEYVVFVTGEPTPLTLLVVGLNCSLTLFGPVGSVVELVSTLVSRVVLTTPVIPFESGCIDSVDPTTEVPSNGGNTNSVFECSPFNHRWRLPEIFGDSLQLVDDLFTVDC